MQAVQLEDYGLHMVRPIRVSQSHAAAVHWKDQTWELVGRLKESQVPLFPLTYVTI